MIAPRTSIADRPHRVQLFGAGEPVPDGEGGWTTEPAPLWPAAWECRITPATQADLQRMTSGTAVTRATHTLIGPYHPGITTATQITYWDGQRERTFYVNGVISPDERHSETIAFCEEQVPS